MENKKGFTYNRQALGSQKRDPFKYTLGSIGIHTPVATKSGKRTRKSRTLSFSRNTRISGRSKKNSIKKKTKLYRKTKLYLVILGVTNPTVS
jgi:hypothetical protein